jgi:hypothetical protein
LHYPATTKMKRRSIQTFGSHAHPLSRGYKIPDINLAQKHKLEFQSSISFDYLRLAPARHPKGFCTLNIEDQMVLYALQQRPLNDSLNLEDAAGFSIYRVSLNGPLSI